MSDYFDQVERDLRAAVRRRDHLPWHVRLRTRRPPALMAVLAVLVVAGPALAAVDLLQSGTAVPPSGPQTPRAFNGVALRTGVQMLSLRTPDRAGGPPWGMRLIRTSRGLLCMQVGRVAFGTVGALGQDDAFGNDGRFHPFSTNFLSGAGSTCVTPDANGNGFYNVEVLGFPASGLYGAGRQNGGCSPQQAAPRERSRLAARALARNRADRGGLPPCPASALRQLYFGLLGPDAVSITHLTASGRLLRTPTSGRDGAYLIVLPNTGPMSENGESTSDSSLFPGAIRSVHYRDGRSCKVGVAPRDDPGVGASCPPVGYVRPAVRIPSESVVASHITAQVEPAREYCDSRQSEVTIPCDGRVPQGFERLDMRHAPPEVLVQISFITHVPIINGQSYYYFQMNSPPEVNPRYPSQLSCAGNGAFGESTSDYTAGERVTFSVFESLSCMGAVNGQIQLVTTTGPSTPAPMGAQPGQSIGRQVGGFNFTIN